MLDYQRGKIYKIQCHETGKQYIGSTTCRLEPSELLSLMGGTLGALDSEEDVVFKFGNILRGHALHCKFAIASYMYVCTRRVIACYDWSGEHTYMPQSQTDSAPIALRRN